MQLHATDNLRSIEKLNFAALALAACRWPRFFYAFLILTDAKQTACGYFWTEKNGKAIYKKLY